MNDVEMERAVRRGEEATRLLAEGSLLTIALDDIRLSVMRTWAALDSVASKDQAEKASDLHKLMKTADIFERLIRTHIQTGQLAQHEIQGREKRLFSFSSLKNSLRS